MPTSPNAQASSEDRGLVRHVNPADPTGPMLNTLAEVEEATKALTSASETSPSEETREPKRTPTRKKR